MFSFSNPRIHLKAAHLMGLLGMTELETFAMLQFNKLQFTGNVWVALGIIDETLKKSAGIYHLQSKTEVVSLFLYAYYIDRAIECDDSLKSKFANYFANKKYRELHTKMANERRTADIPFELLDHIEQLYPSHQAPNLSIVGQTLAD